MKIIAYFLTFSLAFLACNTQDPSISDKAAGTYSLYAASLGGKQAIGLTGTFKI
jgi:hypothetical protein